MSNVCRHCFLDKELVGFIVSQSKIDDCNFCSHKAVECVRIDELFDFFSELLSNYKRDPMGLPLKANIQGNFGLFSSLNSAYDILNYVTFHTGSPFPNADATVNFGDDIMDNVNHWHELRRELVEENRYITDINHLTLDLGWDAFFSSQIKLEKTDLLYRARMHHNSGEPPYDPINMFCPSKDRATAGRANPAGIPFLYLSDKPETVLYEVRASYLDEISIGTFTIHHALSSSIFISDFTEQPTIFHPSRVSERIKATLLKEKISGELSKPLRRYDSEVEYIPTQFICEFIKIFTGVQGIKFRSSLHSLGNNIVIFDQGIMECIDVKQVKVNKVQIFA